MDYRNREMKLEELVSNLNSRKINLAPIFQRGRAWTLKLRKPLIVNILRKRPIPGIFLYKQEQGSMYSYAIVDGKQRIESIMLFIGAKRAELSVPRWKDHIIDHDVRLEANFSVDLQDGRGEVAFTDLTEREIADLREYSIPTIEIEYNEDGTLDEVIRLFVDINQYGAKVSRVAIVKAMRGNDPLLAQVFDFLAQRERRHGDYFINQNRKGVYVRVLKRLQKVSSVSNISTKTDRMWERLVELALYAKSKKHRKPSEILHTFINTDKNESALTENEIARLRRPFAFLADAYKTTKLVETRLATDQVHFYIMVTCLMDSLLEGVKDDAQRAALAQKLVSLGDLMASKEIANDAVKAYLALSGKQTTDADKRRERQKQFVEIVKTL